MSDIASLIESSTIAPDGRRAAIVSTLRQLAAEVPGMPDAPTFGTACAALGRGTDGDTPPIVARRATLREIAAVLPAGGTDMAAAVVWWHDVGARYSASSDPRQAAIGATYAREAIELARLTGNADTTVERLRARCAIGR